jgi:NMD protein affecting ribosome stability and mRNA decay
VVMVKNGTAENKENGMSLCEQCEREEVAVIAKIPYGVQGDLGDTATMGLCGDCFKDAEIMGAYKAPGYSINK